MPTPGSSGGTQIAVWFEADQDEWLRKEAKRLKRSIAYIVREAVVAAMEKAPGGSA